MVSAVSRAKNLKGLFLVLPDTVVQNREGAKTLLKDAFQPPLDAIKALDHMRAGAPATVAVDTGEIISRYATLWNPSKSYLSPALWTGVRTTIAQPQCTYALNSRRNTGCQYIRERTNGEIPQVYAMIKNSVLAVRLPNTVN